MKTAIVLSGGGVKGSWQAGCLHALYKSGNLGEVSAVYGTSVGAINAALFTHVPEKMLALWKSIKDKDDVLSFNWSMLTLRADAVYNMKPLREKLKNNITEFPWTEGFACYTDLETGEIGYASNKKLSREEFLKYVEASGTIPVAMSPVGALVDGGVRELTPLKKAIDDGAERIVVILCSPWNKNPVPWTMPTGFLSFLKIGYRALDVMGHEVFVNDIQIASILNHVPGYKKIRIELYAPSIFWMDTLEFDQKKIQAALEAGQREAELGPIQIFE